MSSFISHLAVAVAGNVLIWATIYYSAIHSAARGIAHVVTILH